MSQNDAIRRAARLHPAHIMMPYDALLGHEGVDAICALTDVLGGDTVHIPHIRTIFYDCIVQQVLAEFNGANYAELGRKYGYSARSIRRIIRENK